jgi:hypothetical protein
MMADDPKNHLLQFRMTPRVAEQRIKAAAAQSVNIDWGIHALERMEYREIIDSDVLRVLRTGFIEGLPKKTNVAGEWKCKMVKAIRGGREVGVVTIILVGGRLFVKTVEWEDLR